MILKSARMGDYLESVANRPVLLDVDVIVFALALVSNLVKLLRVLYVAPCPVHFDLHTKEQIMVAVVLEGMEDR
jgi:uncharacterized membrane protein YesL